MKNPVLIAYTKMIAESEKYTADIKNTLLEITKQIIINVDKYLLSIHNTPVDYQNDKKYFLTVKSMFTRWISLSGDNPNITSYNQYGIWVGLDQYNDFKLKVMKDILLGGLITDAQIDTIVKKSINSIHPVVKQAKPKYENQDNLEKIISIIKNNIDSHIRKHNITMPEINLTPYYNSVVAKTKNWFMLSNDTTGYKEGEKYGFYNGLDSLNNIKGSLLADYNSKKLTDSKLINIVKKLK